MHFQLGYHYRYLTPAPITFSNKSISCYVVQAALNSPYDSRLPQTLSSHIALFSRILGLQTLATTLSSF